MAKDINELILRAVKEESFPEIVYKYRSFNEYTEEIFKNNQLYFPPPIDFNDPFDFQIRDRGGYSKEQIKNYFINRHEVDEAKAKEFANYYSNNLDELNRLIEGSKFNSAKKIGVMCLSKIKDCILMWSHYSDSHKGFVLGFEIRKDPDFFHIPINIEYSEEYPISNFIKDDDNISGKALVGTKSDLWEYEQELRVIKDAGGYYFFRKEALNSVYLGCRISDENRNNILKWIKEYGYINTKIFQARKSNFKFELEFEEILQELENCFSYHKT